MLLQNSLKLTKLITLSWPDYICSLHATFPTWLVMGMGMGWRDGGMEGWRDGGMEGWRDGGMEGWRDGGMEGWRDGGMEGWRDRGMEG